MEGKPTPILKITRKFSEYSKEEEDEEENFGFDGWFFVRWN